MKAMAFTIMDNRNQFLGEVLTSNVTTQLLNELVMCSVNFCW